MCISINSVDSKSAAVFNEKLYDKVFHALIEDKQLVILCIGTDRSTGDSLGPLVGYKLSNTPIKNITLFGTLATPVHAKNLCETINEIKSRFPNPYIIAIDACLGNVESVGTVCLKDKPLAPGAALKKSLPPVGDISITGVVNISGYMEFLVLQNTRLYVVMNLCEIICRSLYQSITRAQRDVRLLKNDNVFKNTLR
ncbi:spore protease YyaC [Clostridium cellulovorans]|uniref:Sporulation protein YyaC n=1 Tax=Clostridium cellulovorans (strain ATCC 35296 / DSM 3052 / OCM 3 / 743B) TaxID=573061 RepID=D9SPC8_CLOC7|nr:spore protease YyaC [Clostridium cellulovorans]ADL54030.1 sporulation protein YyaC [Clostridium cellulovorans 743B]